MNHSTRFMVLLVVALLVVPVILLPITVVYTPSYEEAISGYTSKKEYWSNSSIHVSTTSVNASLTASYLHVDMFSALLVAFNELVRDNQKLIIPYQMFGMHNNTLNNTEVFIGAILAFFIVYNETCGDNNLLDLGQYKDDAWYLSTVSGNASPWSNVEPVVEPTTATKIADNHYRFRMRYYNLSIRVVSAGASFFLSLVLPILTALISEIEIVHNTTNVWNRLLTCS